MMIDGLEEEAIFEDRYYRYLYKCNFFLTLNKFTLHYIALVLIPIKEKTHVLGTFRFPDYAFNENIHNMFCFHEWDVSLIHLFYDIQKIKNTSLLSLEKICYVACTINRAGQLICLRISLHERDRAGIIDKTSPKNKVQQRDNSFYHDSYRTLNKLKFYFPLEKL